MPDIGEMAGQAAGNDEHRVDPDVVGRAGKAVRDRFGRGGDAAQAIVVEREASLLGGGAGLDLDEG